MCGFLTMGSTEVEIDVFDEALGKIEGRGPDMIETSRLFDKTFGFNRLAIMDLSGSNINVVGGVTGDCDTAVKAYLDGTLVPESEPTCGCSHDSCECHDE